MMVNTQIANLIQVERPELRYHSQKRKNKGVPSGAGIDMAVN